MNQRQRILLVDDDESVLLTIEWLLEERGYDTTTAFGGRQGLRLLQAHQYDLVLLDNYLPDLACETLMERLRSSHHEVPYIIMQARTPQPADRNWARDCGARDVVCKWLHDDVMDKIDHCLRRKAA
jgi:DNA-binding response OmpR family regulator